MKRVRQVVVTVLVLVMLVSVVSVKPVSAAVAESGIAPMSINTASITVVLDISSDGTTKCIANVGALSGTTLITGTLKLQKVTSSSTTTVKSWSVTSYTKMLQVIKTCWLTSKGTYKLSLTVTVTRNGVSEVISNSVTVKYS